MSKELLIDSIETVQTIRVSELSTLISFTDIQRLVDTDRVNKIYNEILLKHQNNQIFFKPPLTVGIVDDIWYLIDGQHRFSAYRKMLSEQKYDFDIAIYKIHLGNKTELEEFFRCINDTIPVSEIPQGVSRQVLNTVISHFSHKYKDIFKSTKTGITHRPFIDKTKFEEKISKLLEKGYSSDTLIKRIEAINLELKKKNYLHFVNKNKGKKETEESIEAFRLKANERGGFQLGMFSDLSPLDVLFVNEWIL